MTVARGGHAAGLLVGMVVASTVTACDRATALDTPEGEALCGSVTLGSAYRSGFSPRVQMRLHFDSSKLETGDSPGSLSTFDSGAETGARLLDNALLRPIRPLTHDPLSQLNFGDGRDLNYIFAVSPNDAAHESLLAIISLRNDDQVEVRLIRAGVEVSEDETPDPTRRPLFGMFLLQRRSDECGF